MSQLEESSCAGLIDGKDCTKPATILLRLRYINRVGRFCDSCSTSLLKDNLAVMEDQGIEKRG
jgi:hypothetical protein